MSGHAQKFGGSFPQIFVVKFEKMKVVRKTPEFSKKSQNFVHLQLFGGWQPPKIGTLFNSECAMKLKYL
jgi:hypothetical protein